MAKEDSIIKDSPKTNGVAVPAANLNDIEVGSLTNGSTTNGSTTNGSTTATATSTLTPQVSVDATNSTPTASVTISETNISAAANSHQTTLATAVPVDDEPIVVADVVSPAPKRTKKKTKKNQNGATNKSNGGVNMKTCVSITLGVIVALIIILPIVFTQINKSDEVTDSNNIDSTTPAPTNPPTISKEELRRQNMLSILEPLYENTTDFLDIFDPDSPSASQDRIDALNWIAQQAPLEVANDYMSVIGRDTILQRYIMAVLYFATNGNNWDDDYSFLTDVNECKWQNSDGDKGVICDDGGKVEKLVMYWNTMRGTLPHELSGLSSLREINFGGGSIKGTIPESFSQLTNLEAISMHDNCLTGEIPEFVGDLPVLGLLNIFNNQNGLTADSGVLARSCANNEERPMIIAFDCPGWEPFDTTNSTEAAPPVPWGCDCCLCCNPDDFTCANVATGAGWPVYYIHGLSKEGYPKGFTSECGTEEQESWIADNCPCVRVVTEEPMYRECTLDCDQNGTIPSYDFGER